MRREIVGVGWVMCVLAACGGNGALDVGDGAVDSATTGDGVGDSTSAGLCGAGVPPGEACNALVDVGAIVTPTCVTGAMPTGRGGTIVDGTYVLTAQMLYNRPNCQGAFPFSATIEIAGGCLVEIVTAGPYSITGAGVFTVAGNSLTLPRICLHVAVDDATIMAGTPNHTFTATGTTFTLFTNNSADGFPGFDEVSVFTKQ